MSAPAYHPDVEQRSEKWFELRRGIITASDVGLLVTSTLKVADNDQSRGLTRLKVAERITGVVETTFTSDAMMRGILDEPLARDLYSKTYSAVEECGFVTRLVASAVLGYSPDGLVGKDGLIEVKSAEPKIHLARILGAPIEHKHMAQMQAGLLVTGRKWCDYVSYCGGMPMWTKRVEPDAAWSAAITEAVTTFEANARQMLDDYQRAVKGLPATERIDYFSDRIEA